MRHGRMLQIRAVFAGESAAYPLRRGELIAALSLA